VADMSLRSGIDWEGSVASGLQLSALCGQLRMSAEATWQRDHLNTGMNQMLDCGCLRTLTNGAATRCSL
jgi:hypothetical protein